MADYGFHARLVRTSLALVMLSACSEGPEEQGSGVPEPAQEQRAAARADCGDQVAAAFERLKTSGRPYRAETTVISDRRTSHEIVEFVPPDQMRLSDNRVWITSEYYIQIGQRAWANWTPFPWGWREEYADPRFMEMKLGTVDNHRTGLNLPPLVYECLGRVEFEGTAYLGYRARLENVILSMGSLSRARQQELDRKAKQMPQKWRAILVDPQSTLPAYELVAEENQLDNPEVKERYTYPNNIKIGPPLWCRLGFCRPGRG